MDCILVFLPQRTKKAEFTQRIYAKLYNAASLRLKMETAIKYSPAISAVKKRFYKYSIENKTTELINNGSL